MKVEGKNILIKFKQRWQLLLGLEVLLYALGSTTMVYFLSLNLLISMLTFVSVASIMSIFIKPWRPNLESTSSYIDTKLDAVEYSTGLLLMPSNRLSNIAKLQRIKVSKQLGQTIKNIKPPNHLLRSSILAGTLILTGFLVYQFNLLESFQSPQNPEVQTDMINFHSKDSTEIKSRSPKLTSQRLTIRYPKYTNIPSKNSSEMNIKAVEGSQIVWNLKFDAEVDSVALQSMGNGYAMKLNGDSYTGSTVLRNSGFYDFKFEDLNGKSYTSDLYSIEVTKDKAPVIATNGLKKFTSFNFDEYKAFTFNTIISDDYGVDDAYIIATVSKGSGESVKFREEKLSFDGRVKSGNKNLKLSKKIDLDKMNMEPGDELYFYIEATDLKRPTPNRSRSETFFAVIRDTTFNNFGVEGTLGVDRMPDYFRSQRQLIIDTEKLIADRDKLSKAAFNFKSNELGFDQKALRLKYGEFMGVETDSGLDIQEEGETAEQEQEDDNEDPLAEYTHDHDGDNEHNLVDDKEKNVETSKNPLQEFAHDHADSEMATLFEESLRSKLLKAMNVMWDAELYLRLYEPEKSLPYQYTALKLIQEIKNSARIYVHRIGFDPPPIKEDKRLTGKLDEVSGFSKSEDIQEKEPFPFIRQTIVKIEQLLAEEIIISTKDQLLFEQAGNELATIAIEMPGKYLKTLQQLKSVAEGEEASDIVLQDIQRALFSVVPPLQSNPIKEKLFTDKINQLLLKELDIND